MDLQIKKSTPLHGLNLLLSIHYLKTIIMRKLLILLSLTTVFLVGTAAMEAVPTVDVVVTVKTPGNTPIPDVQVIMNGTMALTTNSEGKVTFPGILVGAELTFTASKDGYTTSTVSGYVVGRQDNEVTITIQPVNSGV
jgi:hypothetical protein